MKRIKKMISCALVVFLVGSLITSVSATTVESTTTKKNVALQSFEEELPTSVQASIVEQESALLAYQNLWNSFGKDSKGNAIYPDEYGGEYIEDGKLVILLTDCSQSLKDEYKQRCNNSSDITFKEVEHSYNSLSSYSLYADQLQQDGALVVSSGVDVRSNTYSIGINENRVSRSSRLVPSVALASNSLPITFTEESPIYSAVNMWGGDTIKNESSGATMTAGICGTYNGKKALLTCGHGNTGSPYIAFATTRIGQVVFQRANTAILDTSANSLGDFSFVSLNSNATTTNIVRKGTSTVPITGTYSSVPVGTTIYKYGTTTKYSWGTVSQKSVKLTYQLPQYSSIYYYVDGLYKSTMTNSNGTNAIDAGDSGGPVYIQSGSSYLLHGIVTAYTKPASGVNKIMYSTPIYYAQNAGFTVKTN